MLLKKFKKLALLSLLIIIAFSIFHVIKVTYPLRYVEYISKYSKLYKIDPYIIAAVIKTESNFKEDALSHKNAFGLMQITPDTAEWASEQMGIKNFKPTTLSDPELNIKMGCWYLNNLREEFNGDMNLVLAAYNGGRGNVQKWLKDKRYSSDGKNLKSIPFKETNNYVKRVNKNREIYKFIYKNKLNTSE